MVDHQINLPPFLRFLGLRNCNLFEDYRIWKSVPASLPMLGLTFGKADMLHDDKCFGISLNSNVQSLDIHVKSESPYTLMFNKSERDQEIMELDLCSYILVNGYYDEQKVTIHRN
ncbi:unnamed protein product [Ambrosiozyma monospora]|uniref:Unnamed protein product n=1 Tax=Ambrosiozyma monospora TaxID=43982 RepID=A0ACB5SS96_AMBMO|nr:unnamed protein product [Ambrosiozyma monospora]